MSIFHLRFPFFKHEENSIRGIDRAKALGYTEVDIDMMPDIFGNIWGDHWLDPIARDGFSDPTHRTPKGEHFDHMNPDQIRRLIAVTNGKVYRIQPLGRLLRQCAKRHIGARLEPKHPIFLNVRTWQKIARLARLSGCTVRMYALPELYGMHDFGTRCVAAAKAAGIDGHVIGG